MCESCLSFPDILFSMHHEYYVHDCTKFNDKIIEDNLEIFLFFLGFSTKNLYIHVFDEFQWGKVPL